MAIAAVETTRSLHELLLRPSTSLMAVGKEMTVASCLGAHLPLYTFPACSAPEQPAMKIARTDSFPVIPGCFDEPRCDSSSPPATSLPTYDSGSDTTTDDGDDAADSDFNSLPLNIPAASSHALSWDPLDKPPSWALGTSPTTTAMTAAVESALPQVVPIFKAAAGAPGARVAASGRGAAHRTQIRRHASDVWLSGLLRSASGGEAEAAVCGAAAGGVVSGSSLLEATLMALWEDRADRGLFRYDVSQCPTRVLPGPLGFVAQLNEGRATKKRPTEFAMDRVLQPFDAARFHFQKAAMTEALVAFQPLYDRNAAAASAGGGAARPRIVPPTAPLGAVHSSSSSSNNNSDASSSSSSPHLVLINVSPIDHGHVLLVPRVMDRLPQALDPSTILLALQFARELDNPGFRVGYNSLGAFATINHLHFHTYHLPLSLPCEKAATVPLPGALGRLSTAAVVAAAAAFWPSGGCCGCCDGSSRKRRAEKERGEGGGLTGHPAVRVSRLVDYPVNAFVVEAETEEEEDGRVEGPTGVSPAALEALAAVVGKAAQRMQAANQPFNLLVSEAGRRVFVFPQCYAERQAAGMVPAELLDTGVNPASFEIAGHLVLKRAEDYVAASEGWAARLLAQVSLEEERFARVAEMCFGGAGGGGSVDEGLVEMEVEGMEM